MKILVTGHMGVIGRQIARTMKEKGHDVHGCDLRGGQDCRETFKINDLRYDMVFHAIGDPVRARKMGVDADLFEWVDRTSPGQLIYFSSSDIYTDELQQEPHRLSEDEAGGTDETALFVAAERLALDRGALVFRPFEVYGEGSRGVFRQVADLIHSRSDPLRPPGCGRVLDFVHVEDVVGAVMEALSSGYEGPPVNLCTGEPMAVDELAIQMSQRAGWEYRQLLCDVAEPSFFRCGDPTRMNAIRPAAISLSQGIAKSFPGTSISPPSTPKKVLSDRI